MRSPHKMDKGCMKLMNAMIVLKISSVERIVIIGVPIVFLIPLKLGRIKVSENIIISEINGRYGVLIKYSWRSPFNKIV